MPYIYAAPSQSGTATVAHESMYVTTISRSWLKSSFGTMRGPRYSVPRAAATNAHIAGRKSSACLACELERHIYNALTRQRTSSFAPKNIVGNLKRT